MNNDVYTIKRLSNELKQPRQNIRRRIIKLDIEAINQHTKKHKNDPLEYDYQAFIQLAESFGVSISITNSNTDSSTDCSTKEIHSTTDDISKDKLIEVLQEQLDIANKSRENLERLLDQQQQLSLNDKNKIELLELEIKGNIGSEEILEHKEKEEKLEKNKKDKWWNPFKRKK